MVAAVLMLLLSGAAAAAQTNTGEISGVVRDSQGGVLPGAAVSAEHVETGTRVERVTDQRGRYFLPSLRVGTYVITAELMGFRPILRSGVTADAPLLQTANAEISDVIEVFNVLNTANFDLPNRIFGTPNFGRIFSAKDPREMQFGAKIRF